MQAYSSTAARFYNINVVKLFSFVTPEEANKAGVCPYKAFHFEPSIIFARAWSLE
jgi:hypothetical protein